MQANAYQQFKRINRASLRPRYRSSFSGVSQEDMKMSKKNEQPTSFFRRVINRIKNFFNRKM